MWPRCEWVTDVVTLKKKSTNFIFKSAIHLRGLHKSINSMEEFGSYRRARLSFEAAIALRLASGRETPMVRLIFKTDGAAVEMDRKWVSESVSRWVSQGTSIGWYDRNELFITNDRIPHCGVLGRYIGGESVASSINVIFFLFLFFS